VIVVMSGEGSTDLGISASGSEQSEGDDLLPGPMAWIVDHILEAKIGYSVIEAESCVLIGERSLIKLAQKLKAARRKGLRLAGKKTPKETAFFFENARLLAILALELRKQRRQDVVAVLFRDADGTASSGRGLWQEKRTSMLSGFAAEDFTAGFP
jgi:hypothetical protein